MQLVVVLAIIAACMVVTLSALNAVLAEVEQLAGCPAGTVGSPALCEPDRS